MTADQLPTNEYIRASSDLRRRFRDLPANRNGTMKARDVAQLVDEVCAVLDALEDIAAHGGGIDATRAEALAAKDAQIFELKQQLAEVGSGGEDVRLRVARYMGEAQLEVERRLAEAEERAHAIVADARGRAAKVLDQAESFAPTAVGPEPHPDEYGSEEAFAEADGQWVSAGLAYLLDRARARSRDLRDRAARLNERADQIEATTRARADGDG